MHAQSNTPTEPPPPVDERSRQTIRCRDRGRFWASVLRWDPPVWDEEDLRDLAEAGITDPDEDPSVFIVEADPTRPRI